jgi:hypothetical protein
LSKEKEELNFVHCGKKEAIVCNSRLRRFESFEESRKYWELEEDYTLSDGGKSMKLTKGRQYCEANLSEVERRMRWTKTEGHQEKAEERPRLMR